MQNQRPYRNFLSGNLKIILSLTCAVLVFLLLRQCSETKEANKSLESVQNYLSDTISFYKDETGKIVAQKQALQGDKHSLEILLGETSEQLGRLTRKFKEVQSAGEITTITNIDTIKILYKDTVPYKFKRLWSKNDKYFFVKGHSSHLGVSIDSLSIPNTLSFAIGDKSTGFWKSEFRIEAVNSNPYVKTTGLDAYSLSVPKKRMGLSLYVGYGLGPKFTLNPQIGIGLSFDLIRF